MYKLGVVSDSHANTSMLKKASLLLKDVNAVAHLGDYESDARMLALPGRELFTTPGNCDGFFRGNGGERTLDINGYRIFLCHGHAYYVKMSLTRLSLRAQELSCDIVLYGHTHVPSVDFDGGIMFVNPGALMNGNYCVIEFRDNGPTPIMNAIN